MTRKEYEKKLLQCERNKPKEKQTAQPDKYPQGCFKEKKCKVCGKSFTPKAPSELSCSEYCRRYAVTEAYYKRNYGITIEEYLDIAERQNYKCAICGRDNFPMKSSSSGLLVVDHDHNTGVVRGLLCHNCNSALGLLQDNPETLEVAIAYLKSVTTIPKGSTTKQLEAVGIER